jgi:hypothetical protein
MRLLQTGTGVGQVLGDGRVLFHAPADNQVRSCSVEWNGDDWLVPLLAGLAFDQYFPNLREITLDGAVFHAKAAQTAALDRFEKWVSNAAGRAEAGERLPCFELPRLASAKNDESVVAVATFVVRMNKGKERLWGETGYSNGQARKVLFASVHQAIWDWIATNAPRETQALMLAAIERQFDYYAHRGIPSDFMMREIGKAPFAAWAATSVAVAPEPTTNSGPTP